MKVVKNLFALALGLVVLSSCNDDDNNANTSKVKVALKATPTQSVVKAGGEPTADKLALTTFQISIGEIEFDINDDMVDVLPEGETVYSDIELEGPFLVDLLSTDAIAGIDLATVDVPNAVYEEIEFDFEPYTLDDNAEMKDNTILVKGTYDGKDFTIVSSEELELELEYEKGFKLDGADSRLFIDLKLGDLKTKVSALDFSSVTLEEDGTILISKDKNKELLKQFESAIENSFDIDEEDEEGEDD